MIRLAVFDANVWVSAAAFPGMTPDRAIGLLRAGLVVSVTSEPLIDQVRRALQSPRFTVAPAAIEQTVAAMRSLSRVVDPQFRLAVITAKESDNRVLECAVAGRADVIVTGDRKHLLKLGQYESIPLVSPADFLALLLADE